MANLATFKDIYAEKGASFIEKLLNQYVIVTEMIDGSRFRVQRKGDNLIFFKGNDKNPINLIDRTIMVYYERPITFFDSMSVDIKNIMPEAWDFCFEYVANTKPVTVTYDSVPHNNLIITDILIRNEGGNVVKVISDTTILEKWAETFDVQDPAVIFQGKLNLQQKQKIKDYLNTSYADLESLFKTQSFTRYVVSILNPNLKKTALNNSLDNMVESIVFKFINGKKVYNAQVIDPLFQEMQKTNLKKEDRKSNDTYQIIMLDIIEFLSSLDINDVSVEGETADQRYINLISTIFNQYVATNGYKYAGMDFQTPDFAKQDVFQLNPEFIDNEVTKKILKNPAMHDLFKIMLSSFKKTRKHATDLLSDESIKIINDIVASIQKKTNAMPMENEVLDFASFLRTSRIQEEENDIFESQIFEALTLDHKEPGKEKVNMFVGRFQPFTLGHVKVLETIHKKNGLPVVVMIVRGGKPDPERRPFDDKMQLKMFKGMQKEYKFLKDAFITPNAAPDTLFNLMRPKYEPVLWGAGTDRYAQYQKMIDKYRTELNAGDDFNAFEIKRSGENISATKVREAIKDDNDKDFKKWTPKGVWPLYKDMQKILQKVGESNSFQVKSFNDFINESKDDEIINESLNSQTRNTFIKQFIASYSSKYSSASAKDRVNNITKVSVEEFTEDINTFIESHSEYTLTGPVTTIEPGEKPNIAGLPSSVTKRGAYSGKFTTIEFEVNDDEIYMILAGGSQDSAKTSTDFKESFVNYYFKNKGYGRIDKENYIEKIAEILKNLKSNGIEGTSKKVLDDNIKTLASSEETFSPGIVKSLNNAMSIGEYLANSKYSKWNIERDKIFDKVKSAGAKVSGLYSDKWNPSDIFLVKPGTESSINTETAKALAEPNEELALGYINGIFVNTWGDTSNQILGISLKEQNAQAGKAKSFLKSMKRREGTELDSYNLTKKEDSLKIAQYYKEIGNFRNKIASQVKKHSDYFTYTVDKDAFQKNNKAKVYDYTRAKYAALKMMYYLLENTTAEKNIFISIASFGLSLGKNPTFFKLIGASKGAIHEPEAFPAQSGVEIIDDNKLINIIDKNTAKGLNIDYKVKFKDEVYQVVLMIRTNTSGISTVTLEINKFKKA